MEHIKPSRYPRLVRILAESSAIESASHSWAEQLVTSSKTSSFAKDLVIQAFRSRHKKLELVTLRDKKRPVDTVTIPDTDFIGNVA